MKFCGQCGNQLSDNALFCSKCGTKRGAVIPEAPVVSPPEAPAPAPKETAKVKAKKPVVEKDKKEKKAMKKGKFIAIICAIVVVACAGFAGFFTLRWYTSPEQQLLRALKAGNYNQVQEIVDEDDSLLDSEDLIKQLKSRIETIKVDYAAGSIKYTDATMELDTIENIGIQELKPLISEVRVFAQRINDSRAAFSAAESFFAAGDYIEAIAQYKLVILDDSNYETAKARASEAADLYRSKMLADAKLYADSEQYSNAILVMQDALSNMPDEAQFRQQLLLYESALAEQILTQALDSAAEYASGMNYLSAIDVLDTYTKKNGENAQVNIARDAYVDAYVEQVLEDAAAYETAGAYGNAIAMLQEVLRKFPDNQKLSQQIALYEKAQQDQILQTALDKAAAYAAIGDYLSAMKTLKTYTSDYGTNASVVVAQNEYTEKYVEAVLKNAEQVYDAADYANAIKLLQTALENVPGHSQLTVRLDIYIETYVAAVVAESDALLAAEDYDGAANCIAEAKKMLPGNAQLNAQAQKVENARLKNFVEVCTPYEKGDYETYTGGATFNMAGVECGNGFRLEQGGYAYFNLQGKYTQMEFDLGHIDGTGMNAQTIKIYLDGVLYKTYTVYGDTLSMHIVIPLTGVHQLKITSEFVTYGSSPYAGFANVMIK